MSDFYNFGTFFDVILECFAGKVLYCKREDALSPTDEHLRVSNRRKPLQNSPEELLERAPATPSSLACFLHQSYPEFYSSSVSDLAGAADAISLADPLFVEWTVA